MSHATLEAMVRNYLSAERAPCVTWQGGSPTLMGVDFYHLAVEVQAKYRAPGARPAVNSLQTEGTSLDESWLPLLTGPGEWMVGLSCDGPTNKSRGIAQHHYERVTKMLQGAGVGYSLLCVVSRENVDHPRDTVRYLADLAGPFGHTQFIPAHRAAPGDPDPGPSPKEWEQFLICVVSTVRDEGLPIVVENVQTVKDMRRGQPGSCIYTGCDSYLVVDSDGAVYPCDFAAEPRWWLGNVHRDRLAELVAGPRMKEFALLKDVPHEDCEDCAILRICGRGCSWERYLVEESIGSKSPRCEATKYLARVATATFAGVPLAP